MEASPSFCQGGALVPGCPPHLGHPSHICIPEGPVPLTPHVGSPSPPSPACPLLLRPCGHGCVVVGGGSCAREVGKVCLSGRGKNWGPRPITPLFLATPRAPLIVRPARPAKPVGSFLETGPCVKPVPSLAGENFESGSGRG